MRIPESGTAGLLADVLAKERAHTRPKVMTNDTDDFLNETIEFWVKRGAGRRSRHEARLMVRNIAGYFQMLDRWERERAKSGRAPGRSTSGVRAQEDVK